MTHKFHPAAALFPLMDGNALNDLIADIRAHGLIEPIVILDGMILDGRNRLRACEQAKVEPRFVEWQGGSSPTEYVLSVNLHRRHLTTGQRAALALDLLPHLDEEAKERQREAGRTHGRGIAPSENGGSYSASEHFDNPATWRTPGAYDGGEATAKAAELVGVGRSTVAQVKAIQGRRPEVIDQLRSGEVNIARAARIAGFVPSGGSEPPIEDGKPSVYYGKGDKWREATEPLKRYLAAWENRSFEFRHVAPAEATKRVAVIDALIQGLTEARVDLHGRTHRARLTI